MTAKYFRGNYTLGLGQPYVILSIGEDENDFISEKFIIFEGFDGIVTRKFYRIRFPKLPDIELQSFVLEEIENCKADINKVLIEKYSSRLDTINYNYRIELTETNSNIISFLLEKFKDDINYFQTNTYNETLRQLINRYKSLNIMREDL